MNEEKQNKTENEELIKNLKEDYENQKLYSDNLKTEVNSLKRSIKHSDSESKKLKVNILDLENTNKVF